MADSQFTVEEIKGEDWRNVVDYEGIYNVSNLGRVKRVVCGRGTCPGRILKAKPGGKGYPVVGLYRSGHKITRRVHCLVAAAFIGPCPEGKEVNHKDGVKTNGRKENLEYITHRENVIHAHEVLNVIIPTRARGEKSGPRLHPERMARGEQHGCAELTTEKVLAIFVAVGTQMEIALRFNTSRSNVALIQAQKTWRHLWA